MFKKLLDKLRIGKKGEPEEIEIQHEGPPASPIHIRIDNLTGMVDVDRVARLVKEGNILFIKLKDLQRRDVGEFQNTLQKMKRLCTQSRWDMVLMEDGYLVVTPPFAKVERPS